MLFQKEWHIKTAIKDGSCLMPPLSSFQATGLKWVTVLLIGWWMQG
jgi:hypothetical protein